MKTAANHMIGRTMLQPVRARDAFQTKIAALIESYEAECERLKPA